MSYPTGRTLGAVRLPPFARSIRFRLSVMYSAAVFGLGGLALGAVYLLVRANLRAQTMTALVVAGQPVRIGTRVFIVPRLEEQPVRSLESIFDEIVLNELARQMLYALAGLFLLSLIVGWFVAGRTLRPVEKITAVASEIQATDLSRRIDLDGPDDELKRLAGTFDEMLDRLDAAFQSQRRFLAQTSHDLRNPLAIIRSNLDLVLSDPDADLEDWQATGEIVDRATRRMSEMIEGLLAAARLEAGTVEKVELDLADLVRQAAEDFAARAAEAKVSVVAEAEPAPVEGDPTSLTRALDNLVDNALRVSLPGSTVWLRSGNGDGSCFLEVADEGPGIDPGVLDGTKAGGRRGLGLTIVREVARVHGGRLEVEPRTGGGSRLIVRIPARAEA